MLETVAKIQDAWLSCLQGTVGGRVWINPNLVIVPLTRRTGKTCGGQRLNSAWQKACLSGCAPCRLGGKSPTLATLPLQAPHIGRAPKRRKDTLFRHRPAAWRRSGSFTQEWGRGAAGGGSGAAVLAAQRACECCLEGRGRVCWGGEGVGVRGAAVWTRGREEKSLPWHLHSRDVWGRVCMDKVWGSEC